MDASKLQIYSLGVVAANKALSSKKIEVTPIEDLPLLDGELTDRGQEITAKAKDTSGASYETSTPTSATVEAEWLPLGCGNRLTAPDVRRGERVILYRFADQDKYWWVTQGQDMRLRKLETVIWGISATKDEGAEPSATNMYWIEISSHKKLIHIHTSKANGEPYAYDIQLNTKDGTFLFQDDNGQKFSLDSRERIWRVENRDGSYVEVNKREIYESAPDLIRRTAKRIEDIAGEAVVVQAGQTISSTAGSSITEAAPNITLDGEVATTANAAIAGNATLNGGTLSLGEHTHTEQGDGQEVSGPH